MLDCMSVSAIFSPSVCTSVYLFFILFVRPTVRPTFRPTVRTTVRTTVRPTAYPSVPSSVQLSTCNLLSICLSVCPKVCSFVRKCDRLSIGFKSVSPSIQLFVRYVGLSICMSVTTQISQYVSEQS